MSAYDYIIVGAGSAGCVLANRLSTDAGTRVALIEAGGGDRRPMIHIPAGWASNFGNPKVDWGYQTEPERELSGCLRDAVCGVRQHQRRMHHGC